MGTTSATRYDAAVTQTKLKRSLSLSLLIFYGLGNILGAGIYVLVGKVAGEAGMFAPFAFLLASVVAAFTALSYAELSARLPFSAGEAIYLQHGFGRRWLSTLAGLMVVLSVMVSSATITVGFAGYLQVFIDIPTPVASFSLIITLGLLAIWGIKEAVTVAAALTVIEVFGLLMIVFTGGPALENLSAQTPSLLPDLSLISWLGIFSGAFLAFYAYLGFEDMVNVAEEVKNPQRNMPLGIIIALLISTLFYGVVSLVAILSVPLPQLSASDAPLALIYQSNTGESPIVITLISLFAVVNGALIQIIMSSRLLYGMARQQWIPGWLASLHPRTHTPVKATLLVCGVVVVLALWLPLVSLAKITSFIILIVFALINLALLRIKKTQPQPADVRVYPRWIAMMGFLTSVALASAEVIL